MLCSRYGVSDVFTLAEVATPEVRDHEVRIAIAATTVTQACVMMRRGDSVMARLVLGLFRPRRRFRIMGTELCGTIERVGRRVTRFKPGDRVFGFAGFNIGTYAEYICLPETASLALAPATWSDAEAAALVDGPTTALYFLRRAGALAGKRIAIVGAAGGVGSAAVQLARHFGARVTGVCGASNAALVTSLGAERVIDYTQADFTALGDTYDIVFDTVGKCGFTRARRCLVDGGAYMTTVGGLAAYVLDLATRVFSGARFVFGMSVEKRAALHEVVSLVAQRALRAVIDRAYPLAELPAAHRYVEAGHKRGNVVIAVSAG